MDKFGAVIKVEELVSSRKKKEQTNKTRDAVVMALAIIGIIAAVAGIAYAVYRFMAPVEDDFEDDFDDDFDDDDLIVFDEDEDEASEAADKD